MVLFSALDAFGRAGAKRGANPESSRADGYFGHQQLRHRLITQTRLLHFHASSTIGPSLFAISHAYSLSSHSTSKYLSTTPSHSLKYLIRCHPDLNLDSLTHFLSSLQLYAFAMTAPLTEPRVPSQTLQVPGPKFIHPVVDGHPAEHPGGPHETTSQAGSRPASIRPPSAINANTMVRYEDADFRQPPGLNYTLRTRKKSIAIFWTLIVLDCVAMPIALYFGLWYGTKLSPNAGRLN